MHPIDFNDLIAQQIRVHSLDRCYQHAALGVNVRLGTLQAAVLFAKLEAFSDGIEARDRCTYSRVLLD